MRSSDPAKTASELQATALMCLWNGIADRRRERRSYEWKVTLGFWAGLLLTTKVVTDQKTALRFPGSTALVVLFSAATGVTICVLHFWWLFRYVTPAHDSDRDLAIAVEDELRSVAGLTARAGAQAQKDKKGFTMNASLFQLGVTVLLTLVTVLVVARTLSQQ